MDKQPEIILREDGFYEITLVYPKEKLNDLINDSYGRMGPNIQQLVTEKFAEKFVKDNYDKIANLIDMETVKLLATRKLAKVVASGE